MTKLLSTVAALALAVAVTNPAFAAGKKSGFDSDSGQGNLSNDSGQGGPNAGTTEISGPHGQIKQGKTANTTIDLPGQNR